MAAILENGVFRDLCPRSQTSTLVKIDSRQVTYKTPLGDSLYIEVDTGPPSATGLRLTPLQKRSDRKSSELQSYSGILHLGSDSHCQIARISNVEDPFISEGSILNPASLNRPSTSESTFGSDQLDLPLDLSQLSQNGRSFGEMNEFGKQHTVELKVPDVHQKLSKCSTVQSRKNYSEQELSAATIDICFNKIGTRRASALYGIPRSTLRNKLLRMKSDHASNERSREQYEGLFPADFLLSNKMKIKSEFSSPEWKEDPDRLSQKHYLDQDLSMSAHGSVSVSPMSENYYTVCKRESYLNTIPNVESKMLFIQQLLQDSAERRVKAEMEEQLPEDISLGRRRNLVKSRGVVDRFAEDEGRPELKIPRYTPGRRNKQTNTFRCPSLQSDWTNTDNSTPSGGSTAISSVLKDVIERTISEKFYTRHQFTPSDVTLNLNGGMLLPHGIETPSSDGASFSSDSSTKTARLHLYKSSPINTSSSNSPDFEDATGDNRSSDSSSDYEKQFTLKQASDSSKKPRPKRGQYRKYNRQLLLEAVKAVQQGDMSVHRAGSYYGVPHSTLEYKVKERHLLRQKKSMEATERRYDSLSLGDENDSPTSSGTVTAEAGSRFSLPQYSREPSDHSISSLAASSFSHPLPLSDSLFSASLASVAAASNSGTGLPHLLSYFRSSLPVGFGWPPMINTSYPFLTLPGGVVPIDASMSRGSFGFCMSASDLLKRLQQKVQANSNLGNHDAMIRLTEMTPVDNGRLLGSASSDLSNGRSSSASSIESTSHLAVI